MKFDIEDHSFFVVRAATNSINDLIDGLNNVQTNPSLSYVTILEGWLEQPWNQKGLLLASPDLYDAWQMQASTLNPASSTFKALWRYMLRSYSRATPFGLYAGAGVGNLSDQTCINFGNDPWKPVSRPDATLFNGITHALLQDRSVRKQLNYSLNNSLYQINQEFRFSQAIPQSTGYKIILTSYIVSEELQIIVQQLTQRSTLSYYEILTLFTQDERPLAEEYINQLIDSQFLSNSLLVPVTGKDWISQLTSLTQSLQLSNPLLFDLFSIVSSLTKTNQSIENLVNSQLKLKRFHAEVEKDPSEYTGSMIQTDLVFSPTHLSLERKKIHQVIQQFTQILPFLRLKNDSPITDFVRRYRNRYQDETIDVLTALDPEYGIGFNLQIVEDTLLLKQIPFSARKESNPDLPSQLVKLIYERFCLTGEMEITLTQEDIKRHHAELQYNQPPVSSYVFGELYQQAFSKKASSPNQSNEESDNRWYFAVKSGTASSAAFLLGRFCLNDSLLANCVQEMCAWEQKQYPDDILAEVVHAPPTPKRSRNVVSRPLLRTVEIPYLTLAGTTADNVINLADLCMRVTEGGQIYLFHKHSGQRIRPRLSTAHKITLGDDIYQFLGYVEQLETSRYSWQWGYFQDQPRLPRITYQNLILQPARWTIRKELLHGAGINEIQQINEMYQLPRFVQLIEMDLSLLLDLESTPCQAIFLDELEKKGLIRLKEWLPASYQPWLINQGKTHISELIIPFKGATPVTTFRSHPFTNSKSILPPDITRTIYPGGSWLYYKVYLNDSTADQFLTKYLLDFTAQLLTEEKCHQFFFIRFNDPDFHLRIRINADPSSISDLIGICNDYFTSLTANSLIYRFMIDTYHRELERYNPRLIEPCERLFSQDSLMVLSYLSSEDTTKTDFDRYAFAIGSVDYLLGDLDFSLEEKRKLCQQNQQSYWEEEGSLKDVKKSLNALYRQYADSIFDQSQQYASYFQQRTIELKSVVDSIISFYQEGGGNVTLKSLLSSIIHMHINRLFSIQQRRHELIIYHLLVRRYESLLARSKRD